MTRPNLLRQCLPALRLSLCLSLFAGLVLAGCSMPRVPYIDGFYTVTDPASGQVYYTDQIRREKRGIVEFQDDRTGAWVSVPGAEVQEISKDEYRKNTAR